MSHQHTFCVTAGIESASFASHHYTIRVVHIVSIMSNLFIRDTGRKVAGCRHRRVRSLLISFVKSDNILTSNDLLA